MQGQGKPAYNAARRIRWLAIGIAAVVALYTGGWYLVAGRISEAAREALARPRPDGSQVICEGLETRGFPFRIGVFCDATAFRAPQRGVTVDAGALRSAAQVYRSTHPLVELDGPLTIDAPGLKPLRIEWSLLRASSALAQPLPQRMSIEARDLVVSERREAGAAAPLLQATDAQAHMRRIDGRADLAASVQRLAIDAGLAGGRDLPPLDGEADIRFDSESILLGRGRGAEILRGQSGRVETLALRDADAETAAGLRLSGPFSFSEDGLLTAELTLFIDDPDRVTALVARAAPEFAGHAQTILAGVKALSKGDGPAQVTLTIRDGRASFGLIPLPVRIPPV